MRRRSTSPSAASARACRTCWPTTCFVLHHGGGSFSSGGARSSSETHHRLILSRYPYWDDWVAEVRGGAGHAACTVAVRGPAGAARPVDHHRRPHPHRVHDRHPAARAGGHRRCPRRPAGRGARDRAAAVWATTRPTCSATWNACGWSPKRRPAASRPPTWPTAPGSSRPSMTCGCSWPWVSGW